MLHNEVKLDRWASELWRYCSNADKKTSESSCLTLLTVVAELNAWLNDSRQYDHSNQEGAWKSVKRDFKESVDLLGAKSRHELDPILVLLMPELSALPNEMNIGVSTVHRDTAKRLMKKLLQKIATLKFFESLWLDLVDSCKNQNIPYQCVDWRSDSLWEVAKHLGYGIGWGGVSGWLSAILVGDNFYIEEARKELEGNKDTNLPESRLLSEAELTMTERLSLCRRFLRMRQKKALNVVWFVIDNASLEQTIMELGAITFYRADWFVPTLFEDGPGKTKLPTELLGEHPGLSKYDFEVAEHRLIARVELRDSYNTQAPSTARNMLKAVLTMAGKGGNTWKIGGSFHVFTDGMRSSSGSHRDPGDIYSSYTDPTAHNLEKLKDDIEGVTTKAPQALESQLQYLGLLKSDKNNDPLSSVIVSVRTLEQVATWVSNGTDKWMKFTKKYLKSQWCRDELKRDLYPIVDRSQYSDMRFGSNTNMQAKLQKLSSKIFVSFHRSGYTMDFWQAMKASSAVANCYRGFHEERKLIQIADAFSSAAKIDNRLKAIEHDYKVLEERLIRVRNAATHGGPIIEGVVDSVRGFGHDLATMAVSKAIWSTLENKNLLSAFTKYNRHSVQRRQSVLAGSPRKMILK